MALPNGPLFLILLWSCFDKLNSPSYDLYRIRLRGLEDDIISAFVPQLLRCIVYFRVSQTGPSTPQGTTERLPGGHEQMLSLGNFAVILHNPSVTIRGVTRGERPRAPKSSYNVTSPFISTVRLLPKDLRFEHGGAKLVSCPGRHLTSLCPWSRCINYSPESFAGGLGSWKFENHWSTCFISAV